MIKMYNFDYKEDKFVLGYTRPDVEEKKFEICVEKMELDTKGFYEFMFQDINDIIEIKINNVMDEKKIESNLYRKGMRVYRVLEELCTEIANRINKECFGIDKLEEHLENI